VGRFSTNPLIFGAGIGRKLFEECADDDIVFGKAELIPCGLYFGILQGEFSDFFGRSDPSADLTTVNT